MVMWGRTTVDLFNPTWPPTRVASILPLSPGQTKGHQNGKICAAVPSCRVTARLSFCFLGRVPFKLHRPKRTEDDQLFFSFWKSTWHRVDSFGKKGKQKQNSDLEYEARELDGLGYHKGFGFLLPVAEPGVLWGPGGNWQGRAGPGGSLGLNQGQRLVE